jgi:sigma-B regulation protein RsbU (phosphoserine phosphatase)
VLLPAALPDIPGLELAARYLPAHLERVGGDFYDAIATTMGTVLLIGDVSGHGPEAATLTSMARHALRTVAMRDHWTPAESLAHVNRVLLGAHDSYSERRFCTVATARLEGTGSGRRLTVSLGGHPHPLLVHPDGTADLLGAPGQLLGLFEEATYHETTVEVSPGDTLVFYTDGLTDAAPGMPNDYDGSLQRVLAAVANQSAEKIADALLDAVRAAGSAPRDDIAILVAKITDA